VSLISVPLVALLTLFPCLSDLSYDIWVAHSHYRRGLDLQDCNRTLSILFSLLKLLELCRGEHARRRDAHRASLHNCIASTPQKQSELSLSSDTFPPSSRRWNSLANGTTFSTLFLPRLAHSIQSVLSIRSRKKRKRKERALEENDLSLIHSFLTNSSLLDSIQPNPSSYTIRYYHSTSLETFLAHQYTLYSSKNRLFDQDFSQTQPWLLLLWEFPYSPCKKSLKLYQAELDLQRWRLPRYFQLRSWNYTLPQGTLALVLAFVRLFDFLQEPQTNRQVKKSWIAKDTISTLQTLWIYHLLLYPSHSTFSYSEIPYSRSPPSLVILPVLLVGGELIPRFLINLS